jgi:hypothetical protein
VWRVFSSFLGVSSFGCWFVESRACEVGVMLSRVDEFYCWGKPVFRGAFAVLSFEGSVECFCLWVVSLMKGLLALNLY